MPRPIMIDKTFCCLHLKSIFFARDLFSLSKDRYKWRASVNDLAKSESIRIEKSRIYDLY